MKKNLVLLVLASLFFFSCNNNDASKNNEIVEQSSVTSENSDPYYGKVRKINTAEFKQLVYNYEESPQKWIMKGTKPCVIDFYADWCRPCKIIAPDLEQLAKEYAGKVNFYKVDVDAESELAKAFNVQSIPLVIFSGTKGNPQPVVGGYPKEEYKKLIDTLLLK